MHEKYSDILRAVGTLKHYDRARDAPLVSLTGHCFRRFDPRQDVPVSTVSLRLLRSLTGFIKAVCAAAKHACGVLEAIGVSPNCIAASVHGRQETFLSLGKQGASRVPRSLSNLDQLSFRLRGRSSVIF
ncbi:hypothetical protein A0H81_10381 [Grifola frondosa]|uniref:Uncharacterized protein n=1 Tax=Grifola frondosa TaxID=5627 RepID=A0A1C7LZP8_GRIFR|nr:hypothetical protein A0H81_10381 [Grifola frondosa]